MTCVSRLICLALWLFPVVGSLDWCTEGRQARNPSQCRLLGGVLKLRVTMHSFSTDLVDCGQDKGFVSYIENVSDQKTLSLDRDFNRP